MSMRAVSGDETGLLKLTDIAAQSYTSYGEQSRSRSIQGLSWLLDSDTEIDVFAKFHCRYSYTYRVCLV